MSRPRPGATKPIYLLTLKWSRSGAEVREVRLVVRQQQGLLSPLPHWHIVCLEMFYWRLSHPLPPIDDGLPPTVDK
jgi:hypothetical protein